MGSSATKSWLKPAFPKATEHLAFNAVCSSTSLNSLSISAKNQAFEKALGVIIDSRMGNSQKKSRARGVLSALLASPINDDQAMTSIFNLYLDNAQFKFPKTLAFMSEYVQQHPGSTMGGSKPTTAKKISKTELDGESAPRSGPNIASLQLMPDKPGVYESRIICWSKFNRYDIRSFELTSNVKDARNEASHRVSRPSIASARARDTYSQRNRQRLAFVSHCDRAWFRWTKRPSR